MLLSFIVPAYNVADYIEKCIRSLEDQDIPKEDYEIIVTNDGSPDDCRSIVENLQKEFTNIVLINQENQGVSMARNNAIAIAKGKYVMPIDPDDYLVANSLKAVIDQAETNQLDVLYCAFEIFDINHQSIWRTNYSTLSNIIDTGYEGYFIVRGSKVKDPDRSWGMMYRMDILRKYQIDYPKEVPYLEDGLFLGKVFAVAGRVGYSNVNFYQRTTRYGSATNSDLFYKNISVVGFISGLKNIYSFEKKLNFGYKNPVLDRVKVKFIILALSVPSLNYNLRQFKEIYMYLKNHDLFKINRSNLDGVYLLFYSLLLFNPYLFYFLYKPIQFIRSK